MTSPTTSRTAGHSNCGCSEGAAEFRRGLEAFAAMAEKREAALLAFLSEPHTVEEIVEHRLVYRPHVEGPHVSPARSPVAG